MASEQIKDFNTILSSFLVQVSPLIGTTYNYHFDHIIKHNAGLPIEQFLVYALPYRDQILNRDESYFDHKTKTNNDDIVLSVESQLNQYGDIINISSANMDVLDEILRLKNIYYSLDPDSKTNLWDILQAMLQLSEEFFRIKGPDYFLKQKLSI